MARRSLRSCLCAALAAVLVLGAGRAEALVFAVNEGVTYRSGSDDIRSRYAAIAADLAKLLKQPVTVEPIADYPTLRKGLASREYDIAYVHPAHLSIVAMRDAGYRLMAVTKGYQGYAASFLVKADSPMKSIADLKGASLGAPDEDSITSWMVRATLRDSLGTGAPVRTVYTRYQDAVPFYVENNLTSAGATAAGAVVRAWQAKGGRILGKSRPVPIKHLLASSTLGAEQTQRVQEYFLGLDATEEGRRKLEAIRFEGFVPYNEADMLAIGKWLGL